MLKNWINMIALSGVIMLGIGCEDNDNVSPDQKVIAQEVNSLLATSSWIITKFEENGIDQTLDFEGISFEFDLSGTLNASKNTDHFSGTWSVSYDSGGDDKMDDNPHSEFDDIDFNIHFTTPDKLTELSEDWEIISYSDSIIELMHISGGDGDISYLTFEKQ